MAKTNYQYEKRQRELEKKKKKEEKAQRKAAAHEAGPDAGSDTGVDADAPEASAAPVEGALDAGHDRIQPFST